MHEKLVQEKENLATQIAEGRAELEYVAALLEQGKTNLARQAAEKVAASPRGGVRPRVYIHLSAKSQVPAAQEIADALRKKNFIVPKEEILVDRAPSTSQVRIFRKRDREEGESIAGLLRAAGVESVEVTYIGGYEDSTALKPGHFEIWLSPPG